MEEMHVHDMGGFLPVIRLGSLVIPTYFVVTSVAFIAAMALLVRRTGKLGLSRNRALDAALVLMISGFVGSRLFHVLFEEPRYYLEAPSRVFEIWRGGFVWYGGAILGSLCTLAFLKWKREPIARYLDLFAPVGALGYAIGRVACLLTGCCYGRICFVGEGVEMWGFRYPTQAFAVVYELGAFAFLLWLEKRREDSTWFGRSGQLFLAWMILHGLGRIAMESFRGDPRGAFIVGLSISTWVSLALIAVSAGYFWKRARA